MYYAQMKSFQIFLMRLHENKTINTKKKTKILVIHFFRTSLLPTEKAKEKTKENDKKLTSQNGILFSSRIYLLS